MTVLIRDREITEGDHVHAQKNIAAGYRAFGDTNTNQHHVVGKVDIDKVGVRLELIEFSPTPHSMHGCAPTRRQI